MGNYTQWLNSQVRPRRFTWVCGPEQILRAEVVDGIKLRLQPTHRIRLFAGDDAEQDIWDACWQLPPPDETRLVIVRHAHLLRRWGELEELVRSTELAGITLVFTSPEDDYFRKAKDKTKEMLPGPAAIHGSHQGQIIKCSINDADKLAWVQARLPGGSSPLALELLELTGQSLSAAAGVCDKLAATGLPTNRDWIKELAQEASADEFTDSLIHGRKRQALLSLPDPEELGRAIGLLASRLDVMAVLHGAVLAQTKMKDIVGRLRVPQLLAAKYRSAALDYPPDRVRKRRQLLADLDAHYRAGATDGIAEAIVAGW